MPSIFISTAHKNQDDEQAGTGDVDYARTLAEKLKELYQSTYGSDEVDCIQHLHDENAIYRHVIEKTKSKNPILHIMLNPPCTGSAFTVEGLVKFKEQSNCKIVVTSIEFAKYNWSLKTQAFSYFKIADHVIFLDDNDKEKAEEFSTLSGVCNTSVIPVPATIPEIPGLKPSEERGNNILFFGMIRKAKGIGYLLNLAQLIKTAQEDTSITIPDSMRDIKIIIVGSIQEHIYDNIFQLTRIMLAMYPEKKEQIEQLINKGGRRLLPEMIKTIIQRLKIELKSYEEQNLPKALPIELYLDVPKDQLAVPFNKCKFSVLPLWRGGSIRNSSMTNMLTHDFITISFSGSATPEILIHGEYSGAMVLLPQTNTSGENVFAENVFDALNARLGDPELNNPTYEKMRYLSNNVLSMTIIIQKHMDLYSSLRVNALQNMPRFVDERFSQDEIELYKKVYAEGKAYQFIKTIRFSDIYDFWGDFVVSMLETKYLGRNWEQKLIRKPLRDEKLPGRHYKANKDGITVSMAGALTEGKEYQPQYTAVEKAGFSKKTSMSVISLEQEYFPPVFGWNKERCEVLGGIMFFPEHLEEHLEEATKTSDANNLLVSIIMQYDGGTVSRSFYFNNILEAEQYLKTKQQEGVWHTDIHSLIAAGKAKSDQKINEVLVRVKWVPKNPKCQLVICSDNLLTRLAMQFRAVDLKVNTGEAFIPISFYIQNREKPNPKVFPYFSTQQQEDLEEALKSTDETLKTLAIMVSWYNNYVQSIESKVPTTQEQELVLSAKCLSLLFCKKLTGLTKIFFLENMFKITLSDSEKLKIEKHDYNEPMLVKLFCEQKKLNKDQLAKFCKEVLQAIVEINFGYNGILDILEKILKINSCLVKEYSLIEEYSLTELLLDSLQKTKSTFCQPKEIEGIIYRLKKYPGELSKDPLLQLDPIIDFFQEKLWKPKYLIF